MSIYNTASRLLGDFNAYLVIHPYFGDIRAYFVIFCLLEIIFVLLGVPQLEAGTGIQISTAVYDSLVEWIALDQVQALCFDTTASNTGYLNGACILLEQKIGRDLLYFACRHHIFELVLKAVFECKMTASSGPKVQLFERLKKMDRN